MKEVSIRVYQDDVFNEVAKTTDYVGSKLIDGDEGARDRIFMADDNLEDLGRFWDESASMAEEALRELVLSGESKDFGMTLPLSESDAAMKNSPPFQKRKGYEMMLEVSDWAKTSFVEEAESALRSFFIASIIWRWFRFVNKNDAKDYLAEADSILLRIRKLLYSRQRPEDPTNEGVSVDVAKTGGKIGVDIRIDMGRLLYDITNETFLRGRTLGNNDNYKEVSAMYATQDEGNREKIEQSINKALSEVSEELAEYGEVKRESDAYRIALQMPGNYNEAAAGGIGEAIYNYVKDWVIGDWYVLTNNEDKEHYYSAANKSMGLLRIAVSKRKRPQRVACEEEL